MSVITGTKATNLFHMKAQLKALELENNGINFGSSIYRAIKKHYRLNGTRKQVHNRFQQLVQAAEAGLNDW